ncbi:hypothetical protein J45TS6_08290 [Paenibacillus sp. J45TS6]|uniref:hypothetical protein n=1 Tax=Paenibacillus sp. J45TS6 TaxID=2807196 RepID=UPI001B2571BC|nr:hypothetical protein [Paenibacillus sp. J45TS6]GIP42370.1 hypothetical protein J45TS6_08290 [Paenibacillus sp. J45TS6]
MSTALSLFPVITEELENKIAVEASRYKFYYLEENEYHILECETDAQLQNNSYQIIDQRGQWDPERHALYLEKKYFINNPHFLFGENGVASKDAEIGLAVMWSSKTSNQRGINHIGSFRNSSDEVELSLETEFKAGSLRGSIHLETILYLKDPGKLTEKEKHLADTSGVILGRLDSDIIIIDGNGSIFPIVEVEHKSRPLWWVECDWADPMADAFDEENVRICINKKHKNYKVLKLANENIGQSPLLIEIISTAVQIIIQKVRESESWTEIKNGVNFDSGSIAQAVHYFLNTFEWDVNSPEDLAISIRQDLETRI